VAAVAALVAVVALAALVAVVALLGLLFVLLLLFDESTLAVEAIELRVVAAAVEWPPTMHAVSPATPATAATPVASRARRAGWRRRRRGAASVAGVGCMLQCWSGHLREAWEPAREMPGHR